MRTPKTVFAILVLAMALTGIGRADTAEMRDGTLMQGKFVGGTAGTIRMEMPDGIKVIETSKVLALTFGEGAPTTAPAGAPTAAPAAAAVPAAAPAPPKPVSVPAGTVLTI